MPDYLLSGTNARNRKCVESVTAVNAAEAVAIMQQRGFTDVELHTDDITKSCQPAGKERDNARQHLRPEQELRLQDSGGLGIVLLALSHGYRRMWVFMVLITGGLVARRVMGAEWAAIDYILILPLVVPLPLVWLLMRPHRMLNSVQLANVEARWDDVMRLTDKFERSRMGRSPTAAIHCAFLRAEALAATGRLDEGVAAAEAIRGHPAVSEGFYLVQLAHIHKAGHDLDGALRCLKQATEKCPDEPIVWLGLASTLALVGEQLQEARAALDKLLEFPLSDQTLNAIPFIEGGIALGEGRYDVACVNLTKSREQMLRRTRSIPLEERGLRLCDALLAIAHARNGDREKAIMHYKSAVPFLRLHKAERLLRRMDAALPNAQMQLGR